MSIRSWITRLTQARVTLVLGIMVLLTCLHSAVVSVLRWQVQKEMAAFGNPITSLEQLRRPIADPLNNAAPLYQAAVDLCKKCATSDVSHTLDQLVEHPEDPSLQRQAVQAYHRPLELLAEGYKLGECNYGLRYQEGFSQMLPDFTAARRLAHLQAAQIRLAKAGGDWRQACALGSQGLRWVRTFEPNYSLIGLMMKIAMVKVLHGALKDVPPAELTAEVRGELESTRKELEKAWGDAMLGERLGVHKLYSEGTAGLASINPGTDMTLLQVIYGVGGQPLFLIDELAYLKMHRQVAADPTCNPYAISPSYLHPIASMVIPNTARAHEKLTEASGFLESLANAR